MCDNIATLPSLRRWLQAGFRHEPRRDAPDHDLICLVSDRQVVFINLETGYERFGKTVPS